MQRFVVWSISALILFGSGLAIGSGLHRDRCLLSRMPFGPTVELACVTREIEPLLLAAERAAIVTGREALDDWHKEIMKRIDQTFLEQHLSFLKKWLSTASYWWTRVTSSEEAAMVGQLEEQNKLFQDTVLSDQQLRSDMETIAARMADAFATALDDRLDRIGRRYRMTPAQLDALLPSLALVPVVDQAPGKTLSRVVGRFKITKRAMDRAGPALSSVMNAHGTLTGADLLAATKQVAHKGTVHGAQHVTAHVAKHVAGHGGKLAAVKIGGVAAAKTGGVLLGGPFVIVAVAGVLTWEWWDHKNEVAERKPKLLKKFDEAFRAYENALLRPDGHLGGVVRHMRDDVEEILKARR